jgi:CheY-like chemotaxis protein
MLPGLRGDRLALEVRRRLPHRRLPIVLLSASADPGLHTRDVTFLAKPVDFKELLKTMERMLEPARAMAS